MGRWYSRRDLVAICILNSHIDPAEPTYLQASQSVELHTLTRAHIRMWNPILLPAILLASLATAAPVVPLHKRDVSPDPNSPSPPLLTKEKKPPDRHRPLPLPELLRRHQQHRRPQPLHLRRSTPRPRHPPHRAPAGLPGRRLILLPPLRRPVPGRLPRHLHLPLRRLRVPGAKRLRALDGGRPDRGQHDARARHAA